MPPAPGASSTTAGAWDRRPQRVQGSALAYAVLLLLAIALPLTSNDYWGIIATRASIYWILVSGLNLVVGYAGQLAIGYVSLLTLGAYTTAVLCQRLGLPMIPALAAAGAVGAAFGGLIGLPALRLRTFYYAMATLGFATIVTQVALAWTDVTGGGVGVPGPVLPAPFDTSWGLYAACVGLATLCTWFTANIARSRFGRGLIAIRDAEVAAEASGVAKPALFVAVFLFSGAVAGIAGGLFADLQSYITPDAFTFDLSVLFFIAILVGGRNSILGPLLATILLTILPELVAPLVAWSTFLYAALLLVIVVAAPGGIAELLDVRNRRPLERDRAVVPHPALLAALLPDRAAAPPLAIAGIHLRFGGVRAIDDLSLDLRGGEVHGLIGPNGSGKTTTLNVLCGFARPEQGTVTLGSILLLAGAPRTRAQHRIARTFQTPRIAGEISVLDNVLVGGTTEGRAGFVETMLALPRYRRDEAALRTRAMLALQAIGLESLAAVRCDRLQHSELRFLEVARALMLRPDFLLLDEPAAGLSPEEISHLAGLIQAIAARGTGVLLVEHHADLIFAVCDRVTVLNLGRVLAAGTPAEIRAHREVVSAFLGG